jgi:hypothetical protein
MTVWAMIGNALYSGEADGYSHDFNWFFVKADPLAIFPEDIALYICPWLNILVFFAVEMVVFAVFALINKSKASKISESTYAA